MKKQGGQFRCTAILVASGTEKKLYRSLEEMPPDSRSSLLRATQSDRAGTILIADEAGEQFLRDAVRDRLRAEEQQASAPAPVRVWRANVLRITLELLLSATAGLLLWFLATLR